MFQKTFKTLNFMKIIVCKIPPGGSETISVQRPKWNTMSCNLLPGANLQGAQILPKILDLKIQIEWIVCISMFYKTLF